VDGGAGKGLRNGRSRLESPLSHSLDQDDRALTNEYLLGAERRSTPRDRMATVWLGQVVLLGLSSGCTFEIEERHCARFPSDPVD
jgi:hypothetical protein